MTDMSEVYLSWRPPETAKPLEQALVDWWVTGKMTDVILERIQPATLAWLRDASHHQRDHSQAHLLADRTSALQPVLNIIQSAQRISRRNLVVSMDGKAFSVTILLPLEDQSTIVYFRELDLRLPDVTPLALSRLFRESL
jgi:hypothetical protein